MSGEKAKGSSFYLAMRLLPEDAREAMFAVYEFCRVVDDIADEGDASYAERRAALNLWRSDITGLYGGGKPSPNAAFLKQPIAHYNLCKDDFLAIIDGVEMDAAGPIRAPDFATLDLYCDRVASAVGRLSVRIFGMEEKPGIVLSHHLGRALQFTNILRDVDEDAGMGRLYLPREFLVEAGVKIADPAKTISDPALDAACRILANLAHEHYRAAERVMAARPKGKLFAPRLMGAVYAQILERMEREGWQPPRRRARLSRGRMMLTALRCWIAG